MKMNMVSEQDISGFIEQLKSEQFFFLKKNNSL